MKIFAFNKTFSMRWSFIIFFMGVLSTVHAQSNPGNPTPAEQMVGVQSKSLASAAVTMSLTSPALSIDSLALVDLYDSTNGNQWTNKSNWKVGRISTWFGVTVKNGRVTKVVLASNNLVGRIPRSIGNLLALSWLDLQSNHISGNIPSTIGNLTSLTTLYLQYNSLTGPIPSSVGNLTLMQYFFVWDNHLSGDIPSTMGNWPSIVNIGIHNNNLTGNLDWIGTLKTMVQFFYYSNPNLNCTLPNSIGNLTNMTVLAGGGWSVPTPVHTKIHGSIPPTIGNCTKLQSIYLDNSELSGQVPSTISNLKSLKVLSLWNNPSLTGNLNEFVTGITTLNELDLNNTSIGGAIPSTATNTNTLKVVISKSKLSIPSTLTSATNLTTIKIDTLNLTQIPNWAANFTKLIYLSTQQNKLTSIPNFSAHVNRAKLEYFVSRNSLDFGDLEPNFSAPGVHPYKTFVYSPQADIGLPQNLYFNVGDPDTLKVTTAGSVNAYQWQKMDNASAWQDVSAANATQLIFPSVVASDSGFYRLKVTNSKVTGLTLYSSPIHVESVEGTLPPIAQDITICAGITAGLIAQGTDVKWYDADTGGNLLFSGTSFTTAILTAAQTYYVSQTINGVESIRRPVVVTVNPIPEVVASSDRTICSGSNAVIAVAGNALQYAWSNGLTNGLSYSVSPTVTTTYTVTGTGSNGCQAIDQVQITVNGLPTASISPTTAEVCEGGAIILHGTGQNCTWSTGQTGNYITVRPATTTSYTATVTDVNGCQGSASRIVTVNTTCPSPPEDLRGVALSTSAILLTWNNITPGVTGFTLERLADGQPYAIRASLSASASSFTDDDLQPGSIYTYRIKAVRDATSSVPSNEVSVKTFSIDQHFVKNTEVLTPGIYDKNSVATLPVGDRIHSWNYLDGDARTIQSVVQEYSPSQKDLIQPIEFDPLGRETKQYLPYSVSTASPGAFRYKPLSEQPKFYNGTTTPPTIPTESVNPYAEVAFENSPLSRPIKSSNPGSPWAISTGATSNATYAAGAASEVLLWRSSGQTLVANEYFAAGTLRKATYVDEEGSTVVTYSDKFGRTILKKIKNGSDWIDTYSVFDVAGNLTHTITPLAVAKALAQTGMPKQLDEATIGSLCFQNIYDLKNQTLSSAAPSAQPQYYIYDKWGNLVLTQNGQQRLINQWTCVKRDTYGRVIVAGLTTDNRDVSAIRSALESEQDRYETRSDNAGNFHGYTNAVFPTVIDTVLSVSYYDDYSFITSQISNSQYAYKKEALTGLPDNALTRTMGMATGTKIRVLDTDNFLWSVSYYDQDERSIQIVSENHKGGIDRLSDVYNFANLKLRSSLVHFENDNGKKRTISRRFEYDHTGRLLRTFHKVDNLEEAQLHELHYDELGNLIKRDLGVKADGVLQSVDYRYNIQGNIVGINSVSPSGNEPVDYFTEELASENVSDAGNTARLDGLVTSMKWKDNIGGRDNVYNYQYDGLKRLAGSTYKAKKDATGWTKDPDVYSENNISYDANGNIKTLDRYSKSETEDEESHNALADKTDQLVYDYLTDSNVLKGVADNSTSEHAELGFKDGNTLGDDYAYNLNGAVTKDLNKGIVSIKYNYQDLPTKVLFANGEYYLYTYDADGTKLTETLNNASHEVVRKKDFLGEFYYVDDALSIIHHEEGQYSQSEGYRYCLTDHLGSPRVWFRDGAAQSHASKATMETVHAEEESGQFIYYDEAVKVNSTFFDHTKEGTTFYSTRLNGTANERTGLAKSLSVMPGDTIRMEVFAKYLDPQSTHWSGALTSLIGAIAGQTAAPGTFVDGGAAGSTGGVADPYAGLLTKDDPATGPKAYLNYLVFDRDFHLRDGGYVKMSDLAREDGSFVKHDSLFKEITIKEAGYVYIFLSNESDETIEVYFDDFKVEQVEGVVDQVNGYYPYGAIAYSWVREGQEFTNGLFQGKEYDSLTGWHDFHARQYDASLARWFAVDPAGQFASPYLAMGNNAVIFVDRDGRWVNVLIGAVAGAAFNVITNWGSINDWGSFGKYALVGAAGGAVAGGTGNFAAAGAIIGGGNAWAQGGSADQIIMGTAVGAISGAVGGAAGGAVGRGLGGAAQGFVQGVVGGAAGGATGGFLGEAVRSGNFSDALKMGLRGGITGAVVGGIAGGVAGALKVNASNRQATKVGLPPRNVWTNEPVATGRTPWSVFNAARGSVEISAPVMTQFGNNSNVTINYEETYKKMLSHSFSDKHIKGGILQLNEGQQNLIAQESIGIIEQALPMLRQGSNAIQTTINGQTVTVMVFVNEGNQVISANIFMGTSARNVNTAIHLVNAWD